MSWPRLVLFHNSDFHHGTIDSPHTANRRRQLPFALLNTLPHPLGHVDADRLPRHKVFQALLFELLQRRLALYLVY
jgi:hypothetical protein